MENQLAKRKLGDVEGDVPKETCVRGEAPKEKCNKDRAFLKVRQGERDHDRASVEWGSLKRNWVVLGG